MVCRSSEVNKGQTKYMNSDWIHHQNWVQNDLNEIVAFHVMTCSCGRQFHVSNLPGSQQVFNDMTQLNLQALMLIDLPYQHGGGGRYVRFISPAFG